MKKIFLATIIVAFSTLLNAQKDSTKTKKDKKVTDGTKEVNWGQIHGNFGLDAQYYFTDSVIGAPDVPEKFRMNGFLNLVYTNGNFSAGVRYEAYLPKPLLGFDSRYEGQGVPFRYATYKLGGLEATAGTFYEQFGNGLVLRAYEERSLGFDNFIDGFRAIIAILKYNLLFKYRKN